MKLALTLSLLVATTATASPSPAVAKLDREYLDGLFASRPHLASFMGDHRFDDRVMDFSELPARRAQLVKILARASALKPRALDDRVDLSILMDGAKLELLYLDEIRDWEWDPRLHDSLPYYDPREIVAARLSDIVHGDYAPEVQRVKSVVAQLAALPGFVGDETTLLRLPFRSGAKAGTRRAPRVYVEQAIKDNLGRIEFLKTEVGPFVGSEPTGPAKLAAAIGAFQRYQIFLVEELLPEADGDWRLGKSTYDKKFALALETERTPDEMVQRARASFDRDRKALADTARLLYIELFGGKPPPASDVAVIDAVKSKLSEDHCKPDELVAAHAGKLDGLRAFIGREALIGLPPDDTLSVQPMPLFKRGAIGAEYLAPGMLEHAAMFHATYYVDPVDPTWPKDKVESYLRGQNDYEVTLTAAHEAYPGHHTQTAFARKELDPLRATLWNGPMVEGWAVFGTSYLVARGYGDSKNARYRFFDLRTHMISAANLILDVKLQRGEMTDDEALRFMVEEGFQEKATAQKKLLRAKLDSTQLCQYYLGLDELTQLAADAGDMSEHAFAAKQEHDLFTSFIAHGSIAVKHLRQYVLGK